jgi:dUTP pyrophosphatase
MIEQTQGNVVHFLRYSNSAVLPKKAHADDACFDLYSCDSYHIYPNETCVIDTGFNIALPTGYAGMVCSRSGLAAKNDVFVLNAPGIIDAGYRGKLLVILHNASEDVFNVNIGDRIAQMFIHKVLPMIAIEVKELDYATTRGENGIGSTGI